MKNIEFISDFYRVTGKEYNVKNFVYYFIRKHEIRYLYFYRNKKTLINKMIFRKLSKKYGIELLSTKIGKGLYLGHAFCITVNPEVTIGNNCNIHKGVTIGQENRGKRKGVPNIGNEVWIGVNATVVGKIKIDDDVLIAPNSYVNIDVPAHSVVLGNPCKIYSKDKATESYINNKVL